MNAISNPSPSYQGVIQPRGFPGLPKDWVSEWETFPSADGRVQLFGVMHHHKDWAKDPRGRVLIVFHGLHEHGGRYLHFPHYLQNTVNAVYCMDHRGHGRSEGLRCHIDSFQQYTDDCATAIRRVESSVRKRFGKSEVHVFAHSLGGLIALRTAFLFKDLPIRSLATSSPLLGIQVKVPFAKRAAARALSKFWGSLHMATEVNSKDLSHDPEVGITFEADRLVAKKATPRLFTEMTDAIADTVRRQSGFEYPLLFQIALQDHIVDPECAMSFYKNLQSPHKQLKTYPGFYHEIYNELGKDQVFEDLKAWIASSAH